MDTNISAPIFYPGQQITIKETSVILSLVDWQKILVILAQNNQVNIIDQRK